MKALNFFSKTEYENLKEQKEYFSQLMPFLRNLDEEEQRILLHKIRNSGR